MNMICRLLLCKINQKHEISKIHSYPSLDKVHWTRFVQHIVLWRKFNKKLFYFTKFLEMCYCFSVGNANVAINVADIYD